jgi:ectoine hydrolase
MAAPIIYPYPINRELYKWPTFSDAEFARRHKLVREFMDQRGLDCLLVFGNNSIWERGWANIRWFTNYMGTMELDSVCVFPRNGDPMLTILGLNGRLPDRIARSIVTDVRGALNSSELVVDRIKELGLERGTIGILRSQPYLGIPHDHHKALYDAFPDAEFPEYSDEFWLMRMVLSDEEVTCLEEAGRIGDAAVSAIIQQLRPGMHERDLFAIIYDTFQREGGEVPCMVLAASESMYNPVSGFQRPRPIDRNIAQGDILLLELGARDGHGYEAQTGKPISFGDPPDDYADMLDTCFEAYRRITGALKPGCTAKDLRAAGQVINDRGYSIVAPLVHGIFNPIDAGPFVGTSHRPDKDVVLEPNMALCVEIHPVNPEATKGVFMGDTYIITEDGARSVNKLPPKLTVI